MIYLDTHVVIGLGRPRDAERVEKEAKRLIDTADDIRVSPMVLLELQILHEIARVKTSPDDVLNMLARYLTYTVCDLPFAGVARAAAAERWTRDPFDRIIVAQARLAKAPLITRDTTIQSHYGRAIG